MVTTLAPLPTSALAAYADNLSRSHRDWLLSVLPGEAPSPAVTDQPLRRLLADGDDLVLEFGSAPGRARRLRLTGPFRLATRRTGLELELHLDGPRGSRHALRLAPPQRG